MPLRAPRPAPADPDRPPLALRRLGHGVRRGAAVAATALLDALLPPDCLACTGPVERQGTLCAACFGALGFVTDPLCDRCGTPVAHAGMLEGGACPGCLAAPPPWARARAALRYDEAARRLVLPLKYADRPELARPLGAWMRRAGAALLAECDLVAPVPAHWRRLLGRRYDQAALLAGAVARGAGRPCVPDLLRRARATRPLAGLDAAARAAAVAHAFAVRPGWRGRLAGRRVLLVDDVLTTGASAGACCAALLAAGASAVDVLAAARVPDPRLRDGAGRT